MRHPDVGLEARQLLGRLGLGGCIGMAASCASTGCRILDHVEVEAALPVAGETSCGRAARPARSTVGMKQPVTALVNCSISPVARSRL